MIKSEVTEVKLEDEDQEMEQVLGKRSARNQHFEEEEKQEEKMDKRARIAYLGNKENISANSSSHSQAKESQLHPLQESQKLTVQAEVKQEILEKFLTLHVSYD